MQAITPSRPARGVNRAEKTKGEKQMNNDQMISTDGIVEMLVGLPKQLLMSDQEIARAENEFTEREETLQIAIVNASINAQQDGKNAEQRELQRKQAVASDPEVKVAQTSVQYARITLERLKAENKKLSREFAAYCHIAELQAARMILQAKGISK